MTNLSARDLEPILAVAGKLAAPFNLTTMLAEVVDAAKQVLKADRGTVWLYDREADELVLRFSIDVPPLRIRADTGLVGSCARSRKAINVQDCYADPRFDSSTDRLSGYRTRCMLTLPLIDHKGTLVGVMHRRDLFELLPARRPDGRELLGAVELLMVRHQHGLHGEVLHLRVGELAAEDDGEGLPASHRLSQFDPDAAHDAADERVDLRVMVGIGRDRARDGHRSHRCLAAHRRRLDPGTLHRFGRERHLDRVVVLGGRSRLRPLARGHARHRGHCRASLGGAGPRVQAAGRAPGHGRTALAPHDAARDPEHHKAQAQQSSECPASEAGPPGFSMP